MNMDNFYDSILNIGNVDEFYRIKEIINIERKKLLSQINEPDGL